LPIVLEAGKKPMDSWMLKPYQVSVAHLNGQGMAEKKSVLAATQPGAVDNKILAAGKAIYSRDGYCLTCHQADGKGLEAAGFPPVAGSNWVLGSDERIIKLVLKGMYGPIEVNGKKYPGQVPMTPFEGMLKDDEVAAVITYVRNSFGNKAPAVTADKVKAVRASIKGKVGFYTPEDLLKQHPFGK